MVFSAEAGAVDVLAMAVEEVCQQELCSLRRRLRFRLWLCGSAFGARTRGRQACRAQGEAAAGGQAGGQAVGLCWGGQAGSQRKLGAARSRVRGRGGARRGVRMGPGVQAQSGGAAAAAVQVPGAALHLVGFDRRTVSERFEGYTF